MASVSDSLTITSVQSRKAILQAFKTKRPVFLWGPPGIGKSDTLIYSNISNIYNNPASSQWSNSGQDVYLLANVAIGSTNTTTGNKLNVSGNVAATYFKGDGSLLTLPIVSDTTLGLARVDGITVTASASGIISSAGSVGGGGQTLYFSNVVTGAAPYLQGTLSRSANTSVPSKTVTYTFSNDNNPHLLATFLTNNGTITSNVIPSGIWDFNFYVSASGTNPQLDIYANVFYVYSSTKTIIASGDVNFTQASYTTITLANQSVYVPTTVLTDYTTTVIGVDVYVIAPTGNPNGKTVTLYTDGSDISHVHTMLPTSVGFVSPSSANNIAFYSDTNTISGSSNIYLTNGGTSLTVTGNVNALNISNLQSNVGFLYSNLNTLQSNINTVQSNLTTTNTNINTVQSNVTSLGNTLQSNINTVQSNLTTTNTNINTVQSNVTSLGNTLQSNINTVQSNVAPLQTNINTVQSNVTSLGNTLESNINTTNSNLNTLSSNVIIGGAISDETSTLSSTSNYTNIRAPFPFTISSARVPLFWLNVLPTVTSNTVFDILKNGSTIYTIKPQIGSTTASNVSANGIPGTLIGGTNSVAIYDLLTIDVDTVGSGTPAGAKFTIYCM